MLIPEITLISQHQVSFRFILNNPAKSFIYLLIFRGVLLLPPFLFRFGFLPTRGCAWRRHEMNRDVHFVVIGKSIFQSSVKRIYSA